ncbi:amidohydrolase family protein [Phytoactinopolyspora limicola]|uniref:amidohydrolase family protein n=1 Tax=Phytoactinopolyspora limicola TaxID=2715536 RepID=UPI00140AAF31|nr:amidohydrolase family protein [Phytoactinopolyspora limicola]
MTTLRLHSIDVLATMAGPEIRDGAVFIRDGWIEQVGTSTEVSGVADESVDLSGHVVLPGLVNTHHHLWQTLARAVPAAQDAELIGWLRALFPLWERLTPDAIRVASRLGAAELALSGCTTVADHHYVWPNGCRIDDLVEGIGPVGLRAHLTRGAITQGSGRSVLPDPLTEQDDAVLAAVEHAVAEYHDPEPGSSLRVCAGPAAVLSMPAGALRELADLARELGIGLHTHLAETPGEAERCLAATGRRPLDHLSALGLAGRDVWFAHAVHLETAEIARLAETHTGVAHCPTSNMRLGSGIAPLRALSAAGVPVGLGVDGSASNDTGHLLAEARQAMLVARVAEALGPGADTPTLLGARDVLRLATRGGAEVLARDDIGSIEAGKAADIVAVDLRRPAFAGVHDPVAALVFCAVATVDHSWVQGRRIVEDGRLNTVDMDTLLTEHHTQTQGLMT